MKFGLSMEGRIISLFIFVSIIKGEFDYVERSRIEKTKAYSNESRGLCSPNTKHILGSSRTDNEFQNSHLFPEFNSITAKGKLHYDSH